MSLLDDLVRNAETVADGYNNLRWRIRNNYANEAIIPKGTTLIGNYSFYNSMLTKAVLPTSVKGIAQSAFNNTPLLLEIEIPSGIEFISPYAFQNSSIREINFPNTLQTIGNLVFWNCTHLENVTFEQGFNCDNLDLSSSVKYSIDTIVSWLNALADRTGNPAYTLTIGSTNIAKLTAEQIAIATNKNWNLA